MTVLTFKDGLEVAKFGMKLDPELAWGWHCNIAMPISDELGCGHQRANKMAAILMNHLFDVDTSLDERYQEIVKEVE